MSVEHLTEEIERVASQEGIDTIRIDTGYKPTQIATSVMVSVQCGRQQVGNEFTFTDEALTCHSIVEQRAERIVSQLKHHLEDTFVQLRAKTLITDTYSITCSDCGASYTLSGQFSQLLQKRRPSDRQQAILKLILLRELQSECEPHCLAKQDRPMSNHHRSIFGLSLSEAPTMCSKDE